MEILYYICIINIKTMGGNVKYKVLLSEEVDKFLDSLPLKAKTKILYNIRLVENGQRDIDLFKKLDGTNLWEIRTIFAGMKYRLLSFFDKEEKALIVTTHGFLKKTQKTPAKEIERAETIRKAYFEQKNK